MKLPTSLLKIRESFASYRSAIGPTQIALLLVAGGGLMLVLAGVIKLAHRPHQTIVEAPRTAITTHPQSQANAKPAIVAPIGRWPTKSRVATISSASSGGQADEPELRAIPPTAEVEEEEDEAGERRREDWFYFQRAYPATAIPPEAPLRMRVQLEREEFRLKQARADLKSSAGLTEAEPEQQAVWAALGPAPIAQGQTFGSSSPVTGRVTAIALDPGYNGTSNQTVYVGAALGGVWRSTDNGANWTPLLDNQPSLAVGAIAIDPTNPNIIYVGTGEGNRAGDTYYGQGLLKSMDGGATWSQIAGPASTTAPGLPSFINCSFLAIEIDPTNPSTLYAATNVGQSSGASGGSGTAPIGNRGIWKSTDGGLNWRNLNPGNFTTDRSATDVLLDPRKPQRVFAAIYQLGLYRSEQGGEPGTWTKLAGGLPDPGSDPNNPALLRAEISVGPPLSPSTESTFYAAFGDPNDNLLGIWRSADGGSTWTKLTSPQSGSQVNYNIAIAVDPTDANVIYYGTGANNANNGGTVFRSNDGGQSWRDLSQGDGSDGLHADTHAIVVSPANRNLLFTGNDGGIWRTNNATSNTVTWKSLNPNLNITQFQSIALHPNNPNFVIGGTQDNGTNLFTGGLSWSQIRGGDGGFTLIDQSNPQVLYHTFFNANNSDGQRAQIGPEVSLNGGNTWTRRGCFGCTTQQGTFNPADRVGFYAPMALNTGFTGQNGNVIYVGTHRLYRSPDRGVTWTGLSASSDGFGTDLTKGSGRLSAIAAHPNLANGQEVVWTGASDGSVQVTTNGGAGAGATFTNLTKAPLPNRFVTDIALDANNAQRAVVTFSGFNSVTASAPGHVFLTTNQGQTWTDISGNLPDVPVTSAAINPNAPNTIYIGTDLGVFQTTNGGAVWARLDNGMPRVAAFMVRYQAATSTLFAATHGRGVYRLTTSRALSTVSAASFSASAIASEAIVAAFGTGLATSTQVATTVPLPTTLAGTRVVVRDAAGVERPSPLFFVGSTQVNFLIPSGTSAGTATVTITADDGTVSLGTVQVTTVAPSLFAANANGHDVAAGYALRVKSTGAQVNEPISRLDAAQNKFVPVPVDVSVAGDQVFLVLFGTGVRFRTALSNVTATIGGTPVPVQYAGPQGVFVGLDQLNVLLPASLAGRGEVDLVLTVDGKNANTLRLNIK
jgi:uncharacterized protein (TIGR03437 family)